MSDETTTPASATEAETPPASPPAAPDAALELAALKEELSALRADVAALAIVKAEPAEPVIVPATETPPPVITPKAPDTSALPVFARLAAGYSN